MMEDRRAQILNVEDEEVDHRAILRMIRKKGLPYDIDRAGFCAEALKMLTKKKYDIVLIDYMMPDGTGLDLQEKIVGIPSIFITGRGDETIAVKAMKKGICDYLIKDPERAYLELLPATIDKALRAHRMEEKNKKTEEALRRSQEYAKNIVDSSLDMIIAVDRDRMITEFNSAAERVFKYAREEVVGKHIDILYANPKDEGLLVYKETIINGKCVREVTNRRKNGELFQSFLSASVLKNSSGEVTGVMGVSRDITEQKKTEEALVESEKRYRCMVESVTDYIYTVEIENSHHTKTTHGESCVAITGYTAKEYDADPSLWLRMIYEEDRDLVMDHFSMMLSGDSPPSIEHRIIHKDSSVRWIKNTAVPHHDENGSLISYDGLVSDITERKRLETELRENFKKIELAKKEWQATFDAISDPIFIFDKDFRLLRTNRAYEEVCGLPYDKIIGKPYHTIFPKMEGPFAMCKEGLESRVIQEEVFLPDLDKIFMVEYYPVTDIEGRPLYYVHVMEDITEAKMAQRMLAQSAKLASLGELAANIAHEINNPMTAVMGYTSIILEDMREGDMRYEALKTIERESLRVREIVRNLLDFARRDTLQKVESDIGEVVEDTISLVIHMADLANIQIERNYKENLPKVIVDTNQMKQVFINLINNACHAMQGGGKLIITTDMNSKRDDGDYILITFKDTGYGIPQQALEKIFEPFYTTKGEKGTGLGLSVSYGVVKDHRGDIIVKSKEGEGSEFTVMLPVAYEVLP